MEGYRERLAQRIVREREAKGWGQRELAVRAEISEKQMGRIEHEKSTPRLSTVRKIAEALGVEVTEILPNPEAETKEMKAQLDRMEVMLQKLTNGRKPS